MIPPVAYPPARKGTVVVWGLFAAYPFGGMIWQVLHHLVGLRRLGFDVWYVEDSETSLRSPSTWSYTEDAFECIECLSYHLDLVGLGDRWIFRPPRCRDRCYGATDLAGLARLYRDADVVFNLCGANKLRPEHDSIRSLVLLQTDPVAPQVAVALGDPEVIAELDAHDFLFTYAENLGAPDCGVPVERYEWQPTRPPVLPDWWDAGSVEAERGLTTVANWRNRGKDILWKGERYSWQKADEFQHVKYLPSRSPIPLEPALVGIGEDEVDAMRALGWKIESARELSEVPAYRDYIRTSLGEFTVAKDQNVRLRSGWFSDRSACYLAAGRPVITQETGCSNVIPTGEGLFCFTNEDEAAAAIEALARDYERHSRAAQEIAREYFSAERVLGGILGKIGLL